MNALVRYAHGLSRMWRTETKQPELVEPFERKERPMVGLLAQLSPEQRERALSYEGSVNLGRTDFRLKGSACKNS